MASNTANIAGSETTSPRPAAPPGITPAPAPWRPASLAGRNSPAPGSMSSRDHSESSPSSGMTPLRPSGAGGIGGGGGGGDRARVQPTSSSAYQSLGSTTSAWVASSRRVPSAGQDRTYSDQSLSVSSSPILGSSGTFARQASMTLTSTLLSTTSSGLGSTASGTSGSTVGNGVGNGSSTSVPKQPLNMEALAAKFADSKEAKEKFAALQLSPALGPPGTPDKERRNPLSAFAPPSSNNPHVAHIKVQRTASLTHSSQSNLVELFARYFNWIEKPHKIENSSDYHLFKDGIKPMWEDPANANGGRWIVTLLTKNPELLDRCWMELAYALVGEQLDLGDDICGAVLSRRTKADRLAVWVRDKDNVEAINGIGKRLVKFLDLRKEAISMEFLITTDAKSSGLLKKYITLDTIKAELAQEAEAQTTHIPTGHETTPSLTIDSMSATPGSATEVSPATPGLCQGASTLEKEGEEETPTIVGTSGLLISVDGKGVFAS
ncbi:hypothetical protein BGZ95_009044 [Linnemannia exigua]|uniref:Uncharacterized protein n=1 Tax=Linnemannia exigua TaxID=604196 RepID=A0AAD4H864_9FUNG|nr:hypothetical protein BGZ95_009044 [Linnemannia exigua]